MLALGFDITVINNSGQGITIGCFLTPWKFDANGALEYGSELSQTGTVVADATAQPGTSVLSVDNSSALNLGAHLRVQFAATVSATGSASVYLVPRNDGAAIVTGQQALVLLATGTDFTSEKVLTAEI